MRVSLNRRINSGLLLLEVLHEHCGKFLVCEKPLTDSREARIRDKSLKLLRNLRSQTTGGSTSSRIGASICVRQTFISIVGESTSSAHSCKFFFTRESLQQDFKCKVRLVLRHSKGTDAVLTGLA